MIIKNYTYDVSIYIHSMMQERGWVWMDAVNYKVISQKSIKGGTEGVTTFIERPALAPPLFMRRYSWSCDDG